ncbi:hypothetical protein H4S08_000643 [Coemansia sp. RSA 1365]|nr:hypothetical protein H4S08_000643 [Coemansia sp. RSA 1365]
MSISTLFSRTGAAISNGISGIRRTLFYPDSTKPTKLTRKLPNYSKRLVVEIKPRHVYKSVISDTWELPTNNPPVCIACGRGFIENYTSSENATTTIFSVRFRPDAEVSSVESEEPPMHDYYPPERVMAVETDLSLEQHLLVRPQSIDSMESGCLPTPWF